MYLLKYFLKCLWHNYKKRFYLFKDIEFDEGNIDDVNELSEIKINRNKSTEELILDFIGKTKNLYVYSISVRLVNRIF